MTTPGMPEAVLDLEPGDVLLLYDVAGGRVHRDVYGQDWREDHTARKTSVQKLLRHHLVEPAEPQTAGGQPSWMWQPTEDGRRVLGEVSAVLAELGYTLEDMRRRYEQLRLDGVL